jgi:hypothetical protein
LTVKASDVIDRDLGLLAAYAIGCGFDLLAALLMAVPLAIWLAVLPQRFFESRFHRALVWTSTWIGLFMAAFIVAAEWVFWHELGVRFNFVAVDYLVYTNEVVGNIWQSYPMPAILLGLALLATGAFWLLRRTGWIDLWLASESTVGRRVIVAVALIAIPLAAVALVSQSDIPQQQQPRTRQERGLFVLCRIPLDGTRLRCVLSNHGR